VASAGSGKSFWRYLAHSGAAARIGVPPLPGGKAQLVRETIRCASVARLKPSSRGPSRSARESTAAFLDCGEHCS